MSPEFSVEKSGSIFVGMRNFKTRTSVEWTTPILVFYARKYPKQAVVVSLLRIKQEWPFHLNLPCFFDLSFLIYRAEKNQGRVSMGNHRKQTIRCPDFKDKKDFNAFQIFLKKSDKNLMILWLGVESNHRHKTVQVLALPKPRRVTELPQPNVLQR